MNPELTRRIRLSACCAILFVLVPAICGGCQFTGRSDKTIEYDPKHGSFQPSGKAFDEAFLDIERVEAIHVPAGTVVHYGDIGIIHILVKKRYGFYGQGGGREQSIDEARKRMKVAYMRNGSTIYLSTFGEFRHIEGGGSIELEIQVPSSCRVYENDELSWGEGMEFQMSLASRGLIPWTLEPAVQDSQYSWITLPDEPTLKRSL